MSLFFATFFLAHSAQVLDFCGSESHWVWKRAMSNWKRFTACTFACGTMTSPVSSKPSTTNGQITSPNWCSNSAVSTNTTIQCKKNIFFNTFFNVFLQILELTLVFRWIFTRKNVQRDSGIDFKSVYVTLRGFPVQHVESDAWCYNGAVQQFGMGNPRRQLSTVDFTTSSARCQSQHGIGRKSLGQINGFRFLPGNLIHWKIDQHRLHLINPLSFRQSPNRIALKHETQPQTHI